MGPGIAALLRAVIGFIISKEGAAAIAGGVLGEIVSHEDVVNEANRLKSGATSPEAASDAANVVSRMLGLDGSNVLWPINRRTGQRIVPRYYIFDIQKGRAFMTTRYVPSSRYRQLRRQMYRMQPRYSYRSNETDVAIPARSGWSGGRGF